MKNKKDYLKTFLLTLLLLAPAGMVFAQSFDTTPPIISNVKLESVNNNSVTITWETNEEADSAINYGVSPDLGMVRDPASDKKEHSIKLENLDPGKTYYFRIISTDPNKNQGISADYKVQTTGSPNSKSDSGSGESSTSNNPPTVEEIMDQVNEIKDPKKLQEIINEIMKAIQGITEDLTIIGPPTVIPETISATVKWTTDREASSEVLFSKTNGFDGVNYSFAQSSPGEKTTDHEVRLIGLEAFTDYSFKVVSEDDFGLKGESNNFTFKTKASLPEIINLRVLKVEENAATLAWDTTVPSKALVEYQDQTTGVQSSVGRPTLATSHQMRLADLTLGTRYVAFVVSENSGGDRVRSQPIQFVTVKDIAPPIISNVVNESTIFPGGESRIQTIIEWVTDEPAFCEMTYREGVVEGAEAVTREKERTEFSTRHTEVITDFAPARAYQFWVDCKDEAENKARSENFVLFTPIQEKNIIDLIIENFQSAFGWVKNVGG